jgi:hypothetical protein
VTVLLRPKARKSVGLGGEVVDRRNGHSDGVRHKSYRSYRSYRGDLPIRAILYAKEQTVEVYGAKAGGGVSQRHRLAARRSPRSG